MAHTLAKPILENSPRTSVYVRGLTVGALLLLAHMGFDRIHGRPAHAQAAATAQFTSPQEGDILQGEVRIRGTADSQAFMSAEIAIAYAGDATDTWFVIAELAQPVADGELAVWNSVTVTDGDYRLRLRLLTLDGTYAEAVINVQVRNYTAPVLPTAAATVTSAPPMQVATSIVVLNTPTSPPRVPSTPTDLPPNAAAVTQGAILGGLTRGIVAVLATGLMIVVLLLRRRT